MLCLLASLARADPYDTAVLADSPISYWKMNESFGSLADTGSAANPMLINNAVFYSQPGPFGCGDKALLFAGGYGAASPNAGYHVATTGKLSVEIWVKYASTQSSDDRSSIGITDCISGCNQEWTMLAPDTNTSGVNRFDVLQLGGLDYSIATGTSSGSLSAYQYIVGTIQDGVRTRIWVNNGMEGQSTTFTGSAGNDSSGLRLAAQTINTGSGFRDTFLNAYIAKAAVYNVELTSVQIANHWNAAQGLIGACSQNQDWPMTAMLDRGAIHWFLENGRRIP